MPSPPPPPPGSRADRRLRRKWAERVVSRIDARRAAERRSGAGFPIDGQVREFLDAYNDRVTRRGFEAPMPFSFGTMQAFVEATDEQGVPFFRLRPERDHAFGIEDFLDFATESPPADRGIAGVLAMPEGEAWHFSVLGDVRDLGFLTTAGHRFVLSGMSLCRDGERLSWLMVGGLVADLEAETARLREEYGKEGVTAVSSGHAGATWDPGSVRAEPLPGTDDVWKTLAYGTFNLSTGRHESRTYSQDLGDTYSLVTDDPDVLQGFDPGRVEAGQDESLAAYAEGIDRNAILFEVAETAFMLPAYFAYRIDLVRTVERPRPIPEDARRTHGGGSSGPLQPGKPTQLVRTLAIQAAGGRPERRPYTPPRHRVELDGFYRRLSPGSVGKDRNGQPLPGRTWVRGHVRWRDRPARIEPILVKASVRAARERADALLASRAAVPPA